MLNSSNYTKDVVVFLDGFYKKKLNMNKFETFKPDMHYKNYKFIEKFLTPDDILIEYGSGNNSIYFSGLIEKVISIECDVDKYNFIQKIIKYYKITNIISNYIQCNHVKNKKLYEQDDYNSSENYIKFPKNNNLKFTKVLLNNDLKIICAEYLSSIIDENVIIFINDFNFDKIHNKINENNLDLLMKHFDIVDFETTYRNIIALRKKSIPIFNIFNNRYDMFKSFNKNKIIAEIGVFRGDFSKFIYDELSPFELHLIDIFEGIGHSGIDDGENIITMDLNESYNNLIKYFKNKNVFIHKGLSFNKLKEFENDYFDIVFIDADHFYESVKKDLDNSYLKVKPGGIICGHDYLANGHSDVYLAVNKFCLEKNLKINYITKEKYASFGIIKTNMT